jgi:hypothetical protein
MGRIVNVLLFMFIATWEVGGDILVLQITET